jgi:membrane associated rhomboid family serine protease
MRLLLRGVTAGHQPSLKRFTPILLLVTVSVNVLCYEIMCRIFLTRLEFPWFTMGLSMFIWAAFLVINDRKDLHDSMTLYSHERRRHAVVLTAFAYCFGHVEALHALTNVLLVYTWGSVINMYYGSLCACTVFMVGQACSYVLQVACQPTMKTASNGNAIVYTR